ncbi:hypothetical protein KC19_6G091500 [Ceratodon purpureus]|uniref:SET domain-containing protein n=1 Tax=Ceratodon purpureus TaxID=3225 RepID=A0A8T0HC96_CERPU|nr:hypothetical protein KC19_6G091500 [Ceratodon purpureus]
MSAPPGHMEPMESPGKRAPVHHDMKLDHASPGGPSVTSKYVGPAHAETVQASEKFDKAGLLAAHLAALHDAYMLERGLLPGTSLPDSEAPPIPPVYSETPWKDFKVLSLAEMKIGKTHRKHVLEGVLCAKSLKVTSVVNVLEEDSGLATKLILTNALPMRASMAQAQNCYPQGSRVAVRDPYLTRFPDGLVGVLVERPHDIAFLSRPENTGENGTTIYGAIGLEGYYDDRFAQIEGRDSEDFSRKIHLFEQQMKQENSHPAGVPEGHEKRTVIYPRPLGHGTAQHREDANNARSSPPKGEAKEVTGSDKLEESVVSEAVEPVMSNGLQDSSPPQAHVEHSEEEESPATATDNLPIHNEDPVTSEASIAATEVLGGKDVETPGESLTVSPNESERVSDVLPNLEHSSGEKDLPVEESSQASANSEEVNGGLDKAGAEEDTNPEVFNVEAADNELNRNGVQETHAAESGKNSEPTADESASSKEEDTIVAESISLEQSETLETQPRVLDTAPEKKMPLIRKQFQRSDSLLAVQEVEDSRARAIQSTLEESTAGEADDSPSSDKQEETTQKRADSQSAQTAATSDPLETHSANDLRVLGNLLFGEENYQGAADLYTRSIRLAVAEEERQGKLVCKSEVILGYSNRAEAYIRLQEYSKALADAKKALSRDPNHLKSLFRKGRALLGLSQYEQALTTLQAAAPRAPTDRDLQAALHESSTGFQQSCHGHYDLSHYYLKGKQVGESPFCADYVGPVIVTDVGRGRGRGLILTKDVEAGELLLVANPIAFLPLQDVDPTRNDISQAFVNGKVQEGFRKIIETAHAQNKGLERLSTLCDGEKVLPAPSVNQTDSESATEEQLDAARIRRIVQLNAINGDATMGWKNLPGSGEQDKKVEHWGLWWLPSFINHSCLPSSSPILVGKALFVFASRDLRAGDEVTRAYFDIFQPLDQRKELSTKGWGFVCYCPRCKLEDALHTSLSKVTEQYVKLMELASKSKSEFGTDEKLTETQTSAALKFFHKLESKLKDFKLNGAENNWVRSSFLHYIDMISGDHELHTHLESIVEALVTVCPGSETTLHMAVVAKDSAKRTFGKKSAQFKAGNQRALNICRFTYGKQKASVLQSIVDKNDYQS